MDDQNFSRPTATRSQVYSDLSEPNHQRLNPLPPSLILRVGWTALFAGIVTLAVAFDHRFISGILFATAVTASMIAFSQRRILEAATLLVTTAFLPILLFLIILGWRPIQIEYGLTQFNPAPEFKNRYNAIPITIK